VTGQTLSFMRDAGRNMSRQGEPGMEMVRASAKEYLKNKKKGRKRTVFSRGDVRSGTQPTEGARTERGKGGEKGHYRAKRKEGRKRDQQHNFDTRRNRSRKEKNQERILTYENVSLLREEVDGKGRLEAKGLILESEWLIIVMAVTGKTLSFASLTNLGI